MAEAKIIAPKIGGRGEKIPLTNSFRPHAVGRGAGRKPRRPDWGLGRAAFSPLGVAKPKRQRQIASAGDREASHGPPGMESHVATFNNRPLLSSTLRYLPTRSENCIMHT